MHHDTMNVTATVLVSASGPLHKCAVAAHGQADIRDPAGGQQMQSQLQICLGLALATPTKQQQQKQKQTQQPPQQTQQPPLHPQQLAAAAVAAATKQQLHQQELTRKGSQSLDLKARAALTWSPAFAAPFATRAPAIVQTIGLSLT